MIDKSLLFVDDFGFDDGFVIANTYIVMMATGYYFLKQQKEKYYQTWLQSEVLC